MACIILKVSILKRKCQKRRFGAAVTPPLKRGSAVQQKTTDVMNDLRIYFSPPRKFREVIFYVQ